MITRRRFSTAAILGLAGSTMSGSGPLGGLARAKDAKVAFPRLSRVGLVPPGDAAEKGEFGMLGTFTCGEFGWGDTISVGILPAHQAAQLDAGDLTMANAAPFSEPKAPVETIKRDGQLFYVSSIPIDTLDPPGLNLVTTAKIDGFWVQATVTKQTRPDQGCSAEALKAATLSMIVRPPLDNETFNAEAPFQVRDFAGFIFNGFQDRAMNAMRFVDPAWPSDPDDMARQLTVSTSSSSTATVRKARDFVLDKTGVKDMYTPFAEGTMR
jgi:hypothetical protein